MKRCRRSVVALVAVPLLLAANDVAGQRRDFTTEMRTGLGYTAVFPGVFAGAGAWHLFGSSRVGVFGDVKTSINSLRDEPEFCPAAFATCTVAWVEDNRNDIFIRDVDEHLIFNAGGVYALTADFMVLLGGGVSRFRSVREYFDEEEEPVTTTGVLYVPHQTEAEWKPQVVAGMLMRASGHFVFRFGYETAPGGMSIGLYIVP